MTETPEALVFFFFFFLFLFFFFLLLPHGVGPPVRFVLQLPAEKLSPQWERRQEPEVSERRARVAAGISDQGSGRGGTRLGNGGDGGGGSWSLLSRSSGRWFPVCRFISIVDLNSLL